MFFLTFQKKHTIYVPIFEQKISWYLILDLELPKNQKQAFLWYP